MKIFTIGKVTMALTEFQKEFRNTLLKISNDTDFSYAHYIAAETDKVRQEIIDGINNGILKTEDDVAEVTKKLSPVYHLIKDKRD